MARNIDPKCKQCRRLGEKLFLKGERCFTPKCAIVKRNYPPGMHGVKGSSRISEYGRQMKEKQKAAKSYRLLEKQMNNYYKKSKRTKGDTGEKLIILFESRLDNVIYRLGISTSRDSAKQLVNHGHILVNGKKLDIPSYQIKIGDQISVKTADLAKPYFQETIKRLKKNTIPSWLTYIDEKQLIAKVIGLPNKDELQQGLETAMIVEFYSR